MGLKQEYGSGQICASKGKAIVVAYGPAYTPMIVVTIPPLGMKILPDPVTCADNS